MVSFLNINALWSAIDTAQESYTCDILPVQRTVIIQVPHYRTGKVMPVHFFIVDMKNKLIFSHMDSTHPGPLKVLCQNGQPNKDTYMLLNKTKIS